MSADQQTVAMWQEEVKHALSVFEFELCGECGCDAEQHRVYLHPAFRFPAIQCLWPIPEDLSEYDFETELNRRWDHFSGD